LGLADASAFAKFYAILANGGRMTVESFFSGKNNHLDENGVILMESTACSNFRAFSALHERLRRTRESLTALSSQVSERPIFGKKSMEAWPSGAVEKCVCGSLKTGSFRRSSD